MGSTTASPRSPARSGLAQLERLDELLAGPRRVAAAYREALGGRSTGLELPCPDSTPADPECAAAGSCSSSSFRATSTATAIVRALSARGIPSKPYFPAVHLMSYYRERFGHREGEFPVCEDVAARSIALPFFPEMTESQVQRVAESLREALGTVAGA